MFLIMKRQLLVNLREKSNFFWTLLFPLLLATLFHFTLGSLLGRNEMETLSVAYVSENAAETDSGATISGTDDFFEYLENLNQTWLKVRTMTGFSTLVSLTSASCVAITQSNRTRLRIVIHSAAR